MNCTCGSSFSYNDYGIHSMEAGLLAPQRRPEAYSRHNMAHSRTRDRYVMIVLHPQSSHHVARVSQPPVEVLRSGDIDGYRVAGGDTGAEPADRCWQGIKERGAETCGGRTGKRFRCALQIQGFPRTRGEVSCVAAQTRGELRCCTTLQAGSSWRPWCPWPTAGESSEWRSRPSRVMGTEPQDASGGLPA